MVALIPLLPFLLVGSAVSLDPSKRADYAYDNNDCRMTVLVSHVFRDEGEYLPSAVIESRSHQIHVTLDKRINVFQLLDGPIINVTKVFAIFLRDRVNSDEDCDGPRRW